MSNVVVDIYARYGDRKVLAYTGLLTLAAVRCNLTDEKMLSVAMDDGPVMRPMDSRWPQPDAYFATIREDWS